MSPHPRIELSADLLSRLRASDEAAYDELVVRVGPSLVNFATQIVRSSDTAQDVVQEVFYRIWRQGERFTPKGTIVAYLFTAARNLALDTLKHQHIAARSHATLAAEAISEADRALAPEADAGPEWDEHLVRLRRVLATLTEHQRTAFALRYDQGLTIPEVAQVLGITPKGAEQLLTRARQLLRERFFAAGQPEKD